MSILLPLQSLELALSAGCFFLLLASHRVKGGIRCGFAAAAAAIVILTVQHLILKEVFPTIAVSLALTIAFGMLTVFALQVPRVYLVILSVIYGAVFAASAYEILFYAMDAMLLLSIAFYIGLAGVLGFYVSTRISHPVFDVICRVGASWIVAASILMSAFFI